MTQLAILGSAQEILIQPMVDGMIAWATPTKATRNRAKPGGGGAFANSSATDADAADVHPIMRRRCRRSLRQANLRRLWRPGRRMRSGPRPQPWMLRQIMRVQPGGRCASAGRNCKAGAGVERSGGGSRAHAMAAAADACIWASGQAATGSGGCGGLAGSPAPRSVDECGRTFCGGGARAHTHTRTHTNSPLSHPHKHPHLPTVPLLLRPSLLTLSLLPPLHIPPFLRPQSTPPPLQSIRPSSVPPLLPPSLRRSVFPPSSPPLSLDPFPPPLAPSLSLSLSLSFSLSLSLSPHSCTIITTTRR